MTRYVVFGAGAIGGTVGAVLHEAGHDVTFIARRDNYRTLAHHGLTFETAAGRRTLMVPVASRPAEAELSPGDVVLLTTKSQDTEGAVTSLASADCPDLAVVCLQNGVTNEPTVLRYFADVFGGFVYCPALHLRPGEVLAYGDPTIGIFDLGRFPDASDPLADAISSDFTAAGLSSAVHNDITRWKYAKLLNNLNNAFDVLFATRDDNGRISFEIRNEAEAVLGAAHVDWAAFDELGGRELPRHSAAMAVAQPYFNSSWQSVSRDAGAIETDYLNGEIVRLGRYYSITTPYNATVQRLCREVVLHHREVRSLDENQFLQLLS